MINDGGWGGGTSVYRMYSLVLLFFKDPEDFVPKTFETMGNTMKVRTIDIFANVSYIGKPNRFRMFFVIIPDAPFDDDSGDSQPIIWLH
jgi:hypothetical protein